MSREDLDRQLMALRTDITTLGKLVDEVLDRALASVTAGESYDAHMAQSREEELDSTYETIEEQTIVMLTLQQPIFAGDLRLLVAALIIAQRQQRAGHSALGVARIALDLAQLQTHLPPPDALLVLGQEARAMLRDAVAAFVRSDSTLAAQVAAHDSTVDGIYRDLRDHILQELSASQHQAASDPNAHRRLTFWLWIAHKLERVADHSVVIARRVQQMQ